MTTTPLPREQFPVADRFRYLNHARVAAPPTMVAHALARDASAASALGSTGQARRVERVEAVRATCAGLLGADLDDVAFVRNTTEGLALVAAGLRWSSGDRVVLADREHPLTAGPWDALTGLGVEVVRVSPLGQGWSLPAERFEEALIAGGGTVRAVVVSWVNYARGWRHDLADLAALAHRHGAILVADLIQGLGVIPADVAAWGVDAAVAGGQKWLLGPEGIGLLHTTPELRSRLRVVDPGWTSIVDDGDRFRLDLTADPSARRFEGGTRNLGGIGGLGAAADLLAGTGIEAVWSHVDALCDRLVDGLTELGATVLSDRSPGARSAIVSASFEGRDAADLADRLDSHGVVVAAWHGAVRFSPHGWNDDDDLAAALHAVRRACRR